MNLQTILHPSTDICNEPELYFHTDDIFDLYDGYFNLFYIEKHKKYTFIDSLELVLKCSGYDVLELMHDREVIRSIDLKKNMDAGSGIIEGRFAYPYTQYDKGVFWFRLRRCLGKTLHSARTYVEGFYEGRSSQMCNPVNLGLNICTYKREQYVLRNMKSLIRWIEGDRTEASDVLGIEPGFKDNNSSMTESDTPEASGHIHVFIIDNGKSLGDCKEFTDLVASTNNIEVIPNDNTGGAGGFSRGMIEAMNRREELSLTHLLMMDDDAVFDPDLFTRLYGFLSFLKKEYAMISVGGALFREDYRYIQHAAGEWFENFRIVNEHPLVDMRSYENAAALWMIGTEHERDRYGAWWCCCYPMEVITRDNLPLPLFVHHDDIQFGMKLAERNGVVFLNGINVWHQGFELAFTGVKQYYNTRNELISMKMFYPDTSLKAVKIRLIKRIIGSLICMRYGDIELIYKAVIDYMKGIQWLRDTDIEALHKEVSEIYKTIVPFKSICDLNISDRHRLELEKLADRYNEVITPDQLREYYDHKKYESGIWKMISINGWLLPAYRSTSIVTPLDSPWKPYRRRYVILYQPADRKCAVMRRDYKWLWRSIKYCIWIMIRFRLL